MRTYVDRYLPNNLSKPVLDSEGPYDIPILHPATYTPTAFIGFNQANVWKRREEVGVHFFLDDFQFERVWNSLRRYAKLLLQYRCCLSPDFSLLSNWPQAVQIWNHYRKHYVGAFLQALGLTVYPTICWSDERSFSWCFDGEPVGGTVAVSSVGTLRDPEAKRLFLLGYEQMIRRLSPATILFYGSVPEELSGEELVRIESFSQRLHRLDGRRGEE